MEISLAERDVHFEERDLWPAVRTQDNRPGKADGGISRLLKKPCDRKNGENERRDTSDLRRRFFAKMSFSTAC
jgi:hypothetical protein